MKIKLDRRKRDIQAARARSNCLVLPDHLQVHLLQRRLADDVVQHAQLRGVLAAKCHAASHNTTNLLFLPLQCANELAQRYF
jgi:hypothetical protein